MTSKPVALLLSDLGVTKTHSRPYVSERQPLLRGAVQDDEVPPRVSRSLRLDPATRAASATSSSPGTTPSIGTRGSACSRRTTSTTGCAAQRVAARARGAGRGVRRPSRALRRGASASAGAPDRGLDQQAEGGARRARIAIPSPRSSRTSRPEPRRAPQRTRPIPRYPPESQSRSDSDRSAVNSNIAAVAPLNTEDLH